MSNLYGTENLLSDEAIAESNEVLEMLLVDDLLRGTDQQIKQFCESEEAAILQEKAVLRKPTLIRLGKIDDQTRRTKLIAYQLAKESGSSDWKKLKFHTKERKKYIRNIMKRFGAKASKIAKMAQKNYIKKAKSIKATSAEVKAQNAK